MKKRLSAVGDGRWVANVDSSGSHVCDGQIEVGNPNREVLAEVGRDCEFEEVYLLSAKIEPGAIEPKVWAIVPHGQPEYVDIKVDRDFSVVNVDGYMVHA